MNGTTMLARYREAQRLHEELTAQLQKLEQDTEVKRDLEFESKLKSLMSEYGYGLKAVIAILDPEPVQKQPAGAQRRVRTMKTYRNPNTGETVTAASFTNQVLQAWKKQYGADVVKGWLQA